MADVRRAVEREYGRLPPNVEVIHDPHARDPETGKPWAARWQDGRITLNAAHLTRADAIWHLEHEAVHDLHSRLQSDPRLRAAFARLEAILARYPHLRAAADGYGARTRGEESTIRTAQELSSGPTRSAWRSLVEAVGAALTQGLGAGRYVWARRSAERIAARLLTQARSNLQNGRLNTEGPATGETRYAHAADGGARIQSGALSPAEIDAVMARIQGAAPIIVSMDRSTRVTSGRQAGPGRPYITEVNRAGDLGVVELGGEWWNANPKPNTTQHKSPAHAARPHLSEVIQHGTHVLRRQGLEGEAEHIIAHTVMMNGEPMVISVVVRERADGRKVMEQGMVQVQTEADFRLRLEEGEAMSDNLIRLPGGPEAYGGEGQRRALRNLVNRAKTPAEAEGIIFGFHQMRRLGYRLENVSLHYNDNQGLDMIFSTQSGDLAMVTNYAVVEAKK